MALLAALALAGCARREGEVPAAAPVAAAGRAIDSATAVASFDTAWSRINATYYDTAFRGIDWPGIRDELRPRAAAAREIGALREVIVEMMGRLGESHFTLIPGERASAITSGGAAEDDDRGEGQTGLTLGLGDRRVLVSRVEPGSPAWSAGVRPGWTVDTLAGHPTEPTLRTFEALTANEQRLALPAVLGRLEARLAGAVADSVTVSFRDLDDRARRLAIPRRPSPGQLIAFGNLPPMRAYVEHERIPAAGGGCVGLVRFPVWLPAILRSLDSAMTAVQSCRGLVIDIRGNPGGLGAMAAGLGGYILDSAVSLGTMRLRSGELRFVVNPRRTSMAGQPMRPFAGPVALVVDERSASTSEVFAAGLQAIGRARVFGRTTSGQALPAQTTRLPSGDVLLHAFADLTGPDGVRIEARGVMPDVAIPLTRASLRAGGDPPLDAAVRWALGGSGGG